MSAPVFIYTFRYGDPEVVMSIKGRTRIEAKRKMKDALGWMPGLSDRLRLTEVTEVTE